MRPSYDELAALVARQAATIERLEAENARLRATVARLTDRVAELERRVGVGLVELVETTVVGRAVGQAGTQAVLADPVGPQPGQAARRAGILAAADRRPGPHDADRAAPVPGLRRIAGRRRRDRLRARQVVDVPAPPPMDITEYQRISKTCSGCGVVTAAQWDDPAVPVEHAEVLAAPGSPVRIGPATLARCALLTCAHYLPVGRSRELLERLTAIEVSTGFLAGVRGRAARRLERGFLAHMRELLASAPVLHADETPGRAAGSLTYVHVACTEYLTLMHAGDRSAATIDAGGVLADYTGVLVRDGYVGYTHLPAIHAWCAAHLLRDLRSISDADPDHQQWALAMAQVLTDAHHAATTARAAGADALDPDVLAGIRNHYLGAIAHGRDENRDQGTELAATARTPSSDGSAATKT